MLPPDRKTLLDQHLMQIRLIVLSLAVGVAAITAVGSFLGARRPAGDGGGPLGDVFPLIAWGAAVVLGLAAEVIHRRNNTTPTAEKRGQDTNLPVEGNSYPVPSFRVEAWTARLRMATIVACALWEGAALIAVVGIMLTGDMPVLLPVVVIGIVMILAKYPRDDRLAEQIARLD